MKRSGTADLPLHYGHVPPWLADRMAKLGLSIIETIAVEYSTDEVIRKISDPFWFQAFGAVMGMDWHSSGITTSVLGALKRSVNPLSSDLGIYICGGKGKQSLKTPDELQLVGSRTGLNGDLLAVNSRLTAKVDNTAVQDGFQLYQHNFILDKKGNWAVIQQGMNPALKTARRYHWRSDQLQSFVSEPHVFIHGENQGSIFNLTAGGAAPARQRIIEIATELPERIARELKMPSHHDVRMKDVNMKRLGAMLWLTHDAQPASFEELLLLKGMGPRALQSLALVSEVIHGTPSRFDDPARFSFAHGGKDGYPFPVPVKVYDETIATLQTAIQRAKVGNSDKLHALKSLSQLSLAAEEHFTPNNNFEKLIDRERRESYKHGGRTVFGEAKPPPPQKKSDPGQLSLWEE